MFFRHAFHKLFCFNLRNIGNEAEFQITHRKLSILNISNGKLRRQLLKYRSKHDVSTPQSFRSTIYALSTAMGISAIAIIRISGPKANEVILRMTNSKCLPPPRETVLRKIKDPETQELLDKGLVLWYPGPKSFTGEDVCELHVHGGPAVIKSILNALSKQKYFRQAEPGEFTKRAFLASKLDLTEAEGLADLLHAETEAQQRQALYQMEGNLFSLYSNWTNQIKKCLASVEAYIDFSEDDNLDENVLNSVDEKVLKLQEELKIHLTDNYRGEKLRSGVNIVLIGEPNVGKSSLINAICQKDVAIVSSIPGTTRDIVEKSVNLGGYLVHLYDTAGIRTTQDSVEIEGVKRAYKKSSEADILLFMTDVNAIMKDLTNCKPEDIINHLWHKNFVGCFGQDLELNFATIVNSRCRILLILNKLDLLSEQNVEIVTKLQNQNPKICAISCLTSEGIRHATTILTENVEDICGKSTIGCPTLTQQRHREHIAKCLNFLITYHTISKSDIVIAAERLRKATNEVGKITGKITTEDLLDVIFSEFCIGK